MHSTTDDPSQWQPVTPERQERLHCWRRSPLGRTTHISSLVWQLAAVFLFAMLIARLMATTVNLPPVPNPVGAARAAAEEASSTPDATSASVAEFLWKSDGGPEAAFGKPAGAGVDADRNLWVTDGANGRFVIFSPDGAVRETWGTEGSGPGQFDFTCRGDGYGGVAFDASGNMYVADAGNDRIQKFGPDRAFLTSWPSAGFIDSDLLVTNRGGNGADDARPLCPAAIAIDPQGRVVVSDEDAEEIAVFAPEGRPLVAIREQWMRPEGVAVAGDSTIWVADLSGRILHFSPDGRLLATWDRRGEDAGELSTPMGIAVDADGRVFVSDQGNRVQIFAPDGAFLGGWGSPGEFTDPVALALDGEGHLYVVEHYGNQVQKFRLLPPFGSG